MAFVVKHSEVIPGCDPLLGGLPLGAGSMQQIRKFPDEATRDAVLAYEAQQRYIMQMQKMHARLIASKAFFDQHKHIVAIEADDGRHIATGNFPDFYAVYSQMKEDNAPKSVEFFHSFAGREFCITNMTHLPTMERIGVDVRTYCDQAGQPMSSPFARSQVGSQSDGPKDIILEAEFKEPIPLVPDKAFRVVVRGAHGTDGSEKRTSVLPSEVFLKAAQDTMDKRNAVIQQARAIEQKIGASDFEDVELLTTANSFTMCTDHDGAGYYFQNDKRINFQHENHAIVSDFKLVMFRKAPALASVSVAIRF
jgi:hypothetical protein